MSRILRKSIIFFAVLIVGMLFVMFVKANNESYILHIYLPWQRLRNALFNHTSLSVGDIIYLSIIALLLYSLTKVFIAVFQVHKNKKLLIDKLTNLGIFGVILYLLFLISWGGNYYRTSISKDIPTEIKKEFDQKTLIQINYFLVDQLNNFAGYNHSNTNLKTISEKANKIYQARFNSSQLPKLNVKQSLFNFYLNYTGVDGYYNPLSGESQINKGLPKFMYPFVVCHEMAHQIGIAAEDDANIVAYDICNYSNDSFFLYSAYFNTFLYTFNSIKWQNPLVAKIVFDRLNPASQKDYEDLRVFYRPYKGAIRNTSNELYDRFLKWNGQSAGLNSYNKLVHWVYYQDVISGEKKILKISPFSK